jgi:hypothetical protein
MLAGTMANLMSAAIVSTLIKQATMSVGETHVCLQNRILHNL